MKPTVSIIIPCYGQAHYLPETLGSVLAQTFEDWECLIVDDGSPDETEKIASSWLVRDKRFHYCRKVNGGLSSARNLGLEHACGQFVQFLDSDDLILPDKLKIQVQQLIVAPSHSLTFCDYVRCGPDDICATPNPTAPYLPPILKDITSVYELAGDWETRLSIPPHCFLFSRIFFDDGVRFDETLANHEDWDCWMRIFLKAEEIHYCPDKLAVYRYHSDSMCNNLKSMQKGYLQAIDKHLSDPFVSREIKTILRVKRSEMELCYNIQIDQSKNSSQSVISLFEKTLWPLRALVNFAAGFKK